MKRRRGRCKNCNAKLPSNRWSYCSEECRRAFTAKRYRENNPLMGISTGTTGAISELRVVVDLLSKGYHVFRAVSPNCLCDLAILIADKLLKIEVRTSKCSSSGKPYGIKDDKPVDVWAWVLPDSIVYDPPLGNFCEYHAPKSKSRRFGGLGDG